MKTLVIVLVLMMAACSLVIAQTYQINWYAISSGGGDSAGTGYKLSATVGKPAAGYVTGSSVMHWIGFWIPDAEQALVLESAAEAKTLQDNKLVSISGKIATTSATDRFSGFFYLEEPDRSSAIRVSCPSWPVAGLEEGRVVSVVGRIGTTSTGERQIVAPSVVVTATPTPLAPVGMNNRSLGGGNWGSLPLGQTGIVGGSGLNNIGMLIETWGRIEFKDPAGAYLLISDGSGQSIRVDTAGLTGIPETGYLSVIGLSSLDPGQAPIVLPRRNTDIKPQ